MQAGFGLNSRNENVSDQLNHGRQEPYSGLIACRICDRIFMSDEALFDHIELHLLLDESAARRQLLLSHLSSSQRSLLDNRFNQLLSTRQQVLQQPALSTLDNGYASSILPSQRNPASSILLPSERNPFSVGTNTRNLDLQSTAPSLISSCSRDNNMPLRTHPTLSAAPQIIFVPQTRTDCFTRPFLNQLETTLLVNGMASFVDREISDNLGDQEMLDVTLKLGREEN
ncbi:hypothetical protein CRYUN_Cryun36dG0076000 [Craigia yunnanensis]